MENKFWIDFSRRELCRASFFREVWKLWELCVEEEEQQQQRFIEVWAHYSHSHTYTHAHAVSMLFTPTLYSQLLCYCCLSTVSLSRSASSLRLPSCVSYLHSYFLYTLFVERSFIWNSGALILSLTFRLHLSLPLPLWVSLALTQRQISLPACLLAISHPTPFHLTHILYAAIHKHVIRTHAHAQLLLPCFRLAKKIQKTKRRKETTQKNKNKTHPLGWPKNAT